MPSLDTALIVLAGIALFAAFVNGAIGYGFSSLTVTLAPPITRLLNRYRLRAVISWSPILLCSTPTYRSHSAALRDFGAAHVRFGSCTTKAVETTRQACPLRPESGHCFKACVSAASCQKRPNAPQQLFDLVGGDE